MFSVKPIGGKSGIAVKYQWLRKGKTVKGATKATYKLTSADAKKRIAGKATASFPGYKTIVTTSHATLVAAR